MRLVQRLATACLDGRVRILDATSGRELMNIQAHGNQTVNCVCFSPNGEQLLSGSYDKVLAPTVCPCAVPVRLHPASRHEC